MNIVDENLDEINKEQAERVIKVAVICINASPLMRPTMFDVIGMLDGRTEIHEVVSDPGIYGDVITKDLRFKSLRAYYQQIQNKDTMVTRGSKFSTSDKPSTSTSSYDLYPSTPQISLTTSGHDLYEINLNSRNNSDFFSDVTS